MASGGGGASLQTKCCFPWCDNMLPYGEGHNSEPLRVGRCCDDCHENRVLKGRLAERKLTEILSGSFNGALTTNSVSRLRISLSIHDVAGIVFLCREDEWPPVVKEAIKVYEAEKDIRSFIIFLHNAGYNYILYTDFEDESPFHFLSYISGDVREVSSRQFQYFAESNKQMDRVERLQRRNNAGFLDKMMSENEIESKLVLAERREKEHKAQAEADKAYLAEERAKATAEKKAHKEAMDLKKKQEAEAEAKAEKANEDFANSPEGKALAKAKQDAEAEVSARERKKKEDDRAEELARLAKLRKEKKEAEAKAKAEEEKARKGGKSRRDEPEDDGSGAGGGGGKSKKGKKN